MLALSNYTFSIALHVIFAVSFIGVAGAFRVIGSAAREDITKAPFALGIVSNIYKTVVIPGVIGVSITGLYQVGKGDWSFTGDAWLLISTLIFLLLIAGLFVTVPGTIKAKAEAERFLQNDPPVPTAEFLAIVKRNSIVGPLSGFGLIAITFLMVAGPSL